MNEKDTFYENEIDLKEISRILWNSKKFILFFTLAISTLSILYSLSLTNYYKSQSLLVTRSQSDNQNLSQYRGLASMAGITLPSSSSKDKTAQIIELIKSREFVKHLIEFEDVLPSIMIPKSFDESTSKLSFDKNLYDAKTKSWKKEAINKGLVPSYLDAHEEYKNNILSISQDKITGFTTIKIEHISPIFAHDLLELIIRESNELIRRKDMHDSEKALEFLSEELISTPFTEIKSSINSLIQAQIETQMITSINDDYILLAIEPPYVPEKKSKPNRALICLLGSIIGGMLSIFIVLSRHYLFNPKNSDNF